MSLTDAASPEGFYAGIVVPLKQARNNRGETFFSCAPDAGAATYWKPVETRGADYVTTAGADGLVLLDALKRHWESENQHMLTRMVPALQALRAGILAEATNGRAGGEVISDFVYPLF